MKNLILISLDTVRADVAYSGQFKSINKLRKKGATFLNTISSSPLTPVSHATVFTGLQPYHHGMRHLFREKLKKNTKTLASILREQGYVTGAIVSCPGMNNWYGFNKGFDHYDDEIPRLPDGSDPLKTVDVKKRGTALKRADIVTERACKWLEENKDKNFFLFLHFFDAHWPYEAPSNYGGNNIYEQEIAYSDHYLGIFLDYLKKNGLFDKSTIICFSDHGEDLEGIYKNDKGGKLLGHPEECGHGCLLYDQTQKVVLIVKDEKITKNVQVENQVRLVDVLPTVLDLLDIQYLDREIKLDGVSLLPLLKGRKVGLLGYSETYYPEEQTEATKGKFSNAKNKKSFRIDNRYKFIINIGSNLTEFYDLKNDCNELINNAQE